MLLNQVLNMNKILFFFLLVIFPLTALSQNVQNRDSLINRMCEDLNLNKHLNDSLRIDKIYKKHFYPYLSKVNENDVDSIAMSVYYRFQRNCPEFLKILSNSNPGKGDWEIITKEEKPISTANTEDCKNITSLNNLYYLEHSGEKVLVQIKDGYWIEKFIDGTFSKLNFTWITNSEFQLEFIQSNNETRGNMSNKGDKFNYEIITKEETYYAMVAYIVKQDVYLKFKIYYN